MLLKKLYIVTGKGGVGKTMTALALSKALEKSSSKKVFYTSFDSPADDDLCKSVGVTAINYSVQNSTVEYIGRKLGSETIAKWIMKAPFFKALFNIVPSLGYMITLGHIIDTLEDRDDMIIVCDAPSSGHILTVLESPKSFNQIFKTGALVKDIHRMLNFLQDPKAVESWVLSVPSELALSEGLELVQSLKDSGLQNIKSILNNVMTKSTSFPKDHLPDFLLKKLASEKEVIAKCDQDFSYTIAMFVDKSPAHLVEKIEKEISKEILSE